MELVIDLLRHREESVVGMSVISGEPLGVTHGRFWVLHQISDDEDDSGNTSPASASRNSLSSSAYLSRVPSVQNRSLEQKSLSAILHREEKRCRQ
jgi:hypothetical protein